MTRGKPWPGAGESRQVIDMVDEAAALPDDADGLRALVISLKAVARERSAERDLAYEALKLKTLELEKLKMQLAKLRRMQFGKSSEKLAREAAQLELAIEEIEKRHILRTLDHTDWNKTQAAAILQIERSTLDRKIKAYELKK